MSWRTIQVPHRAQRRFDVASCPCGWRMSGDDHEMLDAWADAHTEAFDGWLMEMEEFVPEGSDG